MQDFEKLGLFYLGRHYDLDKREAKPELVLYESKDMVTHAVCVGMTGSGKTGLCLTVLEEAAIDGIPAIVIDPKGDLCNLLLTFPELRGADFEPWINEDDAKNAGVTKEVYAEKQAEKWKEGLAAWGEDGARIQRMRDAVEIGLYTPGSELATPISILHSFEAPSAAVMADTESLHDKVGSMVTGLLGLLGIDGDPLQSREHILISNILTTAWNRGQNLDLAGLIHQIQSPPIAKIGVLDVESFYPTKDRLALAMRLNNLLAAPGFTAWLKGVPLDIQSLLYSPAGKPRVSIISIAHLDDSERMFFVTLLLGELVSWMRAQSGTTSLRALFYMDEIFGYFPPVANPPSKQPLLTLLKQARAYGLGVLLATQNPVDLDYKGLSNTGTWFIGRLQTERDKARVLDGLEGAAAATASSFDRAQIEMLLSGLGNRVFLMNNVHENGPLVFQVRWTLSYLRGPLARDQIRLLARPKSEPESPRVQAATTTKTLTPPADLVAATSDPAQDRPMIPPEIPQLFVHPSSGPDRDLVYVPALLGRGRVYFHDRRAGIEEERMVCVMVPLTDGTRSIDWTTGEERELTDADLSEQPAGKASYGALPALVGKLKTFETWKKSFGDWLYRGQKIELWKCAPLKLCSMPGESERDFRARLQQVVREQRDQAVEKIRQKNVTKLSSLTDKIRRARETVDRETIQATEQKAQTAISFGSAILGALFGRKAISTTTLSKAATTARGVGRSMKESTDIDRAKANVVALEQQLNELETKLEAEIAAIAKQGENGLEPFESIAVKPKRADVSVELVAIAWLAD